MSGNVLFFTRQGREASLITTKDASAIVHETLRLWETSKNEFSDSECPNLKEGIKSSLENCQESCLNEANCTAINFDQSSGDCTLRGCSLPVVPPAQNDFPTYDGHWLLGS